MPRRGPRASHHFTALCVSRWGRAKRGVSLVEWPTEATLWPFGARLAKLAPQCVACAKRTTNQSPTCVANGVSKRHRLFGPEGPFGGHVSAGLHRMGLASQRVPYNKFLAISVSHLLPLASSFCLLYNSSSWVSVENSKLAPSTIASTGHASWQKPQ